LFLHPDQLVTLGISCESCHFGGREHVEEKRPIRYVPCGSNLLFARATPELIRNARDSPYVINSICAQCHFADVSKYPNGAGTWNAREAIDLINGACGGQIKCTDCHDPHRPEPPGGGPDSPAHIATCLNCHEQFQDAGARAKHTQHPTSSGVTCLDCHMPRMVQGLEEVVRTHQISSPTQIEMLREGAPNACNLCHLDRSIRWTVEALETGWGRKLTTEPQWLRAYQGNLDGPVGRAWLKHRVPIVRLVAAHAYARSPLGKSALPDLLETLNDSRAVNRMFGLFAVERVLGRRLNNDEYAPLASPDVRLKQVNALRSSVR
jgi:hypothetical protein